MAAYAKMLSANKLFRFQQFSPKYFVKFCSTEQVKEDDTVKHLYYTRKNEYVDPVTPEDRKLLEYRHAFPEFLPEANLHRRHKVAEKLERMDMLKRRTTLYIPEFYVGSILAVTVSDPYAPGKVSRFVGICIVRDGQGLRSSFLLRNHVQGQGVEVMYHLYNPTLRRIEVLRLEKRLDDHLMYLRDVPAEYSTFPFDMQLEPHNPENNVPVNELKVPLNNPPWYAKWHVRDIKGVQGFPGITDKEWRIAKKNDPWWNKYDLMKQYRLSIPEEEQVPIFKDVHKHCAEVEEERKIERRRSILIKSQK